MRLIDADALKEKFKEHYDLFVSAYKNEQDMSVADRSRVDEILNSMAEVINAPTVCDIEQIRAEIASKLDNPYAYIVKQDAYNEITDIINSYTKRGRHGTL